MRYLLPEPLPGSFRCQPSPCQVTDPTPRLLDEEHFLVDLRQLPCCSPPRRGPARSPSLQASAQTRPGGRSQWKQQKWADPKRTVKGVYSKRVSPETTVLETLPLAPFLLILALQGQFHHHLPLPFCEDLLSLISRSLEPFWGKK